MGEPPSEAGNMERYRGDASRYTAATISGAEYTPGFGFFMRTDAIMCSTPFPP